MNCRIASVSLGITVLLSLAAAPAAAQQVDLRVAPDSISVDTAPIRPSPAVSTPAVTAAQASATRKMKTGWQADVHGGFLPGSASAAGAGSLPLPLDTFTTTSNLPSRFVPSYYFGDGAALLNTVASSNNQTQSRLVPLDGILTSGSGRRKTSPAYGVRIGHTITSYALFEFSLDMGQSRVTFSDETLAAIEATRASYKAVFDGILVNNAANTVTTSTATVDDNRGKQLSMIASVNINVGTFGRFTPFVTGGGGLMLSRGVASSFTIAGAYKFNLNNPTNPNHGVAFGDTDSVTVTYGVPSALVKVFGGGVQMRLSARSGFRADVRASLTGMAIEVETNSTIPDGSSLATVTRGTNGPQVQFRAGNGASSLTGGGDRFTTFTGSGKILTYSFGYFVRF
jgi:hypothetical protein